MKRVYVVGWHYNGGAGFDWYHTAESADKAFEEEKVNCHEFKADDWEAYRFDFDTDRKTAQAITNQIDADLDDLCGDSVNLKKYRAP